MDSGLAQKTYVADSDHSNRDHFRYVEDNVVPKLPDDMPAWQQRLSHISHFLLYFFLISMPISGFLGNSGGVDYGIFSRYGVRGHRGGGLDFRNSRYHGRPVG